MTLQHKRKRPLFTLKTLTRIVFPFVVFTVLVGGMLAAFGSGKNCERAEQAPTGGAE